MLSISTYIPTWSDNLGLCYRYDILISFSIIIDYIVKKYTKDLSLNISLETLGQENGVISAILMKKIFWKIPIVFL